MKLMYAARNGHVDIAIALLEYGADIEAKNNAGLTAADCARNERHQHIYDLLKNWVEQQALSTLIQVEPAYQNTGFNF